MGKKETLLALGLLSWSLVKALLTFSHCILGDHWKGKVDCSLQSHKSHPWSVDSFFRDLF